MIRGSVRYSRSARPPTSANAAPHSVRSEETARSVAREASGPSRTGRRLPESVAELGSRPMMEPGRKPLIDLLLRRARVLSPQVLAHQGDSCLEEIERHPERFGDVAMVRGHVSSLACATPGVLGDNLPQSTDSLYFGPVPHALIKGRRLFRGAEVHLNSCGNRPVGERWLPSARNASGFCTRATTPFLARRRKPDDSIKRGPFVLASVS